MAKPIAQTFYINEPVGGVEGVFLTKVDIYFQSVSSVYGVELQIRTTDNGEPSSEVLPNGSKILEVADLHANSAPKIVASADASKATTFTFSSPIPLQSQTSYALVIIPIGGNPDYKVWTAQIGGDNSIDITTKTPIYNNNDTGDLFLASNDRAFTAVNNEDIKFTIYTANFTSSSGQAVFDLHNEENIEYYSLVRGFTSNEYIFVSDGGAPRYRNNNLTISSNTAAFSANEQIYQSNGSANVAFGTLYFANTSKVLLTKTIGIFSNNYQIKGATSGSNAVVTSVVRYANASSNTTIRVPFTGNGTSNIFYANQSIYVGTPSRGRLQPVVVTSVVNSTAITVSDNTAFTTNNCLIGAIRGDGLSMFGRYSGPTGDALRESGALTGVCFLWGSTANSSANFTNIANEYLIGYSSHASAVIVNNLHMPYNALVPHFSQLTSQSTEISWSFEGISVANTSDTATIKIVNNIEKEFTDQTRVVLPRSKEIIDHANEYTTKLYANFTTSNTKFSPYIDNISNYVTFTSNRILSSDQTKGYIIDIDEARRTKNGNFFGSTVNGVRVGQSNGSVTVYGDVLWCNNSSLHVGNTTGTFNSTNTIYIVANTNVNALPVAVTNIDEKYSSNVFMLGSRYISKNVILAENQDAEDLRCFVTAYRPSGTDFMLYGKFIHADDPDRFNVKVWTKLPEISSPALLSSSINKDDFVELEYGLAESLIQLSNSTSCNTTSANITVTSTTSFTNNMFVYIHNTSNNAYNVRQIDRVGNNTVLVLKSTPSFLSTNANIGIIDGIEDTTSAFINRDNSNIIRYVSADDVVYDSYKTFAIKIVPVSDSLYNIPRAADYRAIALQV